jgi:hypothetical protein
MKKAFITFSLLATSLSAAAYSDLFPGTVFFDGNQLILTRCDLVQNKYILVDKQGKTDFLVKQFPAEIRDKNIRVSVNVTAEYREKDGQNYLYVENLSDINVGKSCHMSDMFK